MYYKLKGFVDIEKLDWGRLSSNPAALHILERNSDKIDGWWLSSNPVIFELDYAKIKEKMDPLKKRIDDKGMSSHKH